MKNILFLLLLVTCVVQGNAQTSDQKWGLGGGAGTYGTFKNGGIGIMPEFYLSRFISPKFDVMYQSNIGLFNTTVTSNFDLAIPVLLNLRYKLLDESKKLRPFVYGGPGLIINNSNSKMGATFDLGIGTKYYLTSNWAGFFEAGYFKGVETVIKRKTITNDYWKVTAGLELNLGKASDSDMDGVSDKKDKCPNTPAGVAVDKEGCPLDTDGDGVEDYLDDCPTIKGLSSKKGCPDSDKDGIIDKDDACPDQAGPASLKGCPDKDGDGVADKDDKCLDTPKGVKVDASGCALDSDKDGIADYMDDCPTVAGTKENKGCPVKEAVKEVEKPKVITKDQVELQNIKVSAVHFTSGKSFLTDYSKGILDKLVKLLNQNKDFNVNLYGYSDNLGSDELNLKLSQDRIDSAIQYLESKGISVSRISKQNAFGKAKPAASNATAEGRLQNRRVEFEIYKMK